MSNLLPDKLLKQRFKLQLQSLDSPSDFSNSRSTVDPGVSPMTDLAMNLNDTSLNSLTPVQDSKRRLSMGSDTSTPSPEDKISSLGNLNHTPLTSLTNKPRRINQPSRLTFNLHGNDDNDPEANKENMPFPLPSSGGKKSPTKGLRGELQKCSPAKIHSGKPERTRKVAIKSGSLNFAKMSPSPGKVSIIPRKMSAPALVNFSCLSGDLVHRQSPSKKTKLSLMNKPDFQILDDVDDSCSRDSGFNSQNLLDDDFGQLAKAIRPVSMEDILALCSPGKDEDGVTPLKSSPERGGKEKGGEVKSKTDGFDFFALDTIAEDKQEDSPCIDLSSLLSNKIMMSDVEMEKNKSELQSMAGLFQDTKESLDNNCFKETRRLFNGGQKRGKIRRALSMLDRPACTGSPVSRFNEPVDLNAAVSRFKRPEPPRPEFGEDVSNKRQRIDSEVSSITTKITSSSIELKSSITKCTLLGGGGPSRPKFFRSFSENEISVMKSCELKENVDNILPDSSRLYSLPAIEDKRNPSLRSLSCHTLAQLIKGEFNHAVNSFRIIDCRYAYEFNPGHIRHAENWQHGEDEEFLNEFLPKDPLSAPPAFLPGCQKKRDILIFHCEFSSQRGPDFYRKLREKDRTLNQHVYPALHHPEIYLLHLGYKQFYTQYPDLCVGDYTTMDDPRHQARYREMRSKSKSWSGGTIMRTGKLNRNLIM